MLYKTLFEGAGEFLFTIRGTTSLSIFNKKKWLNLN